MWNYVLSGKMDIAANKKLELLSAGVRTDVVHAQALPVPTRWTFPLASKFVRRHMDSLKI
jgi:hypothetical protein